MLFTVEYMCVCLFIYILENACEYIAGQTNYFFNITEQPKSKK